MGQSGFQIKIVEQSWLDGCLPEQDLCSHGKIKLIVGGQSVTAGNENYGISESALALLRTLEHDHSPTDPVAERLVFHGCGTMLMFGCPIGVDWNVSHLDGCVRISNVVRNDGTSELSAVKFPNLVAEVPEEEYRCEVIAFAKESKQLFVGAAKSVTDEFDRQQYEEFWAEYDRLLNCYENAVRER